MTGLRRHLRLPWFALAAIVGMLSMSGGASARSTAGASKPCCVVPTPSECCCRPAKVDPLPSPVKPRAESMAVEDLLSSTGRPCECRPDEPVAPASKPESSPTGRRPERSTDGSIAACFPARPMFPLARFVPPVGSPPKLPLHLLTTHLLI